MKRYYILIGHLRRLKDEPLESWGLTTYTDIVEAENKKQAKKRVNKRLKKHSDKKHKYVLLEIEVQTLF